MNASLVQPLVANGAALSVVVPGKVAAMKRRKRREDERPSARLLSLFGRVVVTALLIVGVQWAVLVAAPNNHGLLLGILAVPALFAAHAITKAVTVTTADAPRTRGGRR